ncbi:saccharopine dehydrogenase [Yinghuangia soli]|uniref:Saccharopine dehydrogenase [NAD(+), L-lysine-forming] n=1 Tax=Yinghuangia soli TaxID=2908204 RepID=A0AA41U491_9ACTN|nr:saccharopine dehydrogenase [Yinghuangia soli]MCF2528824.1 saccharopine dehydrogenase [Yinghuangia soli]
MTHPAEPAEPAADPPRLWLRCESRGTERRAPLVPEDAARLVSRGIRITVEESPRRVFPLDAYVAAGCTAAPEGSWTSAPAGTYILGLKELLEEPAQLRHDHIYFGHAYKGQPGAGRLLARFAAGGGALLDLEYLTDDAGRRLAAFGYWAGYAGAALAVLHRRGMLGGPLVPLDRAELDARLRAGAPSGEARADGRALVIGALGRCGRGACDALETAGIDPLRWDLAETRALDRDALLAADLLVNTVLSTHPVPPFLVPADLDSPARRISVIADVTCDVGSDCNVLPVYDAVTDWENPARRLRGGDHPVDVIAIDNLPSLLPAEASRAFSADLWPLLARLGPGDPAWRRCRAAYAGAADPEAAGADVKEDAHVR